MSQQLRTPFESLESAQEYMRLLAEELECILQEVDNDRGEAEKFGQSRRLDALHLVCYKLQRFSQHVDASRRILNDLRLLRRLFVRDLASYSHEEPQAAA